MRIPFAKAKKNAAPSEASQSATLTDQTTQAAVTSRLSDGEAALDALGAILRAFGMNAFDIGELDAAEVGRLFERWAQHALVATPLDSDKTDTPSTKRDWAQLRQLVVSHRKRESTYVTTSLTHLREAIWSFVEIVNRATSQDKQDGVLARERLVSLRSALACKDIETLRREVSQTASALENALADQQKKQEERLAEFASNVRSLGERLESAKREGTLDPLTRLPNRACFDEFLGRTVKLAALVGRSVSLMMVDIDRFKAINDTVGHQGGDAAIKAIADCLVRRFPRRGDLVARYGGDEFAVVLRDTEPNDTRALAQRLVESVRATKIVCNQREVRVSSSIGVAFLEEGDTAESWLSRADAALYRAQTAGRDRWVESPAAASAPSAAPVAPRAKNAVEAPQVAPDGLRAKSIVEARK